MDKLDATKLRIELARINKPHAWLARKLGFSKQWLHVLIKAEDPRCVVKMAEILGVKLKDLIK